MSIIKFIQIGCTIRQGSPTFLNMVRRANIPYATSFMYISNEDAQGKSSAPYGSHEAITVVMVDRPSLEDRAIGYSQVGDKVIIILPATGLQRDFNLGMAVGSAPLLDSGVYIADNGKVIEWSKYHFDR